MYFILFVCVLFSFANGLFVLLVLLLCVFVVVLVVFGCVMLCACCCVCLLYVRLFGLFYLSCLYGLLLLLLFVVERVL